METQPVLKGLLSAPFANCDRVRLQKEAGGDGVWLQQACCLAMSLMNITSKFLCTRNLFCCEKENSLFFVFLEER